MNESLVRKLSVRSRIAESARVSCKDGGPPLGRDDNNVVVDDEDGGGDRRVKTFFLSIMSYVRVGE